MRSIAIALIALSLAACDSGAPEYVYVRTSSVMITVTVRWFAEPADGVEFNNPLTGVVALDQRGVKFPRPGRYRLWATSHPPLDGTSNTLEVDVTARD